MILMHILFQGYFVQTNMHAFCFFINTDKVRFCNEVFYSI